MEITAINNDYSDFNLVELKQASNGKLYPYCKIHGAMNKLTPGDKGLWRCMSAHSVTKVINGKSIGYKENDQTCIAGCKQNDNPDALIQSLNQ